MITKAQLDTAISKAEEKMETKTNFKIEALKEHIFNQMKDWPAKNRSYGKSGLESGERIELDFEREKIEQEILHLQNRVAVLEEILRPLASGDVETRD
jgi:uncharacterized protein YicC (UPF0701 family)